MITIDDIPVIPLNCLNEDHIEVAKLINELKTLLDTEAPNIDVLKHFENLLDHCENHFMCEEFQMKKYQYKDFESHKMIHDEALSELKNIHQQWIEEQDRNFLQNYIANKFTPWLIDHIENNDYSAARAIVAAGGS